MKHITLNALSAESEILVGEGAISQLEGLSGSEKKLIVADPAVLQLYRRLLPDWPIISVSGGEVTKTLAAVEPLYREFLNAGLERSSLVVAVGGGAVSDAVGFAAATFKRGLRFGIVATTLLSQVDAAVGGKNAVNFAGFKNIVGTVRQPEFVICSPIFLGSLREAEIRNGFAEIIKAAIIASESLYSLLEREHEKACRLEPGLMEEIIYQALLIKTAIVEEDEFEEGSRVKLNFGHTLGHALEGACQTSHGEAVSMGMILDLRLSERRGLIDKAVILRSEALLACYGLPVRPPATAELESIWEALTKDKKRHGSTIRMALISRIGDCAIHEVELEEIREVLNQEL